MLFEVQDFLSVIDFLGGYSLCSMLEHSIYKMDIVAGA
jgi:hypothetical protein